MESVEYFLRPLNTRGISNSIIRPIDCCVGAANPQYAPMRRMGLKFWPEYEPKSYAGFLAGELSLRIPVDT